MNPPAPNLSLRVRAYPPALRLVAALLIAIPLVCVVLLAAGLLLDLVAPGEVERVPLPLMVRRLLLYGAIPALGFVLLRWHVRAEVEVGADTVTIAATRTRWDIPRAAIHGVIPWRLPWPGPGLTILRAAGRPMSPGLALPDPTPLAAALGVSPDHPRLVAARAARATRWLRHPLHALILAPLVPTAILFRLHQIILYGGWLGEYHWYGLGRWLTTLFMVWLSVAGAMLCWHVAWRLLVAAAAWPAALLAEPRARALRWTVELVAMAGYYGGVAWLLWARLGA